MRPRRPLGHLARRTRQTTIKRLFPKSLTLKLVYHDHINVTVALGLGTYTFRGNSIYDPDETGTGHQPMGIDKFNDVYDSYYVRASGITITAYTNKTLTNGVEWPAFFVAPMDTSGTLIPSDATASNLKENNIAKWTHLPLANSGTSKTSAKITHYATTASVLGDADTDASDYQGLIGNTGSGSNPSQQWYWNITLQDPQVGVATYGLFMDVKLVYYVTLSERVLMAQS